MIGRLGLGYVVMVSMIVLGSATRASGGIITAATLFSLPGFSTGSLGPVGATPSPNNDNAIGPSPNTIPYSIVYNTFGMAEFEFAVAASGGTTEYLFSTPGLLPVVNNTGIPWTDYHFELGFGTGSGFVRSSATDQLDFDMPDADPSPTATIFAVLNHQTDTIDWSGGIVPSIGSVRFMFAVDVPDGLDTVNPYGVSRFTLRQTPTAAAIPEPAVLLLMTSAAAGLARRRRSWRK
jgi:hypothetical protein